VIRVYDEAGNVIETHEHKGEYKEPSVLTRITAHFPLRRIFMIPLSPGDSRGTRAGLDGIIPSISR